MERTRAVLLGIIACAACTDPPPGKTFYERTIQPILDRNCAGNTSGCHKINAEDEHQFAAGNLDVTSFENVQKRRDTLTPFGAYQKPLFLIKAVAPDHPDPMDPNKQFVVYFDQTLPIDVLHGGASVLEAKSDAFLTLQTWLQNGATLDGLKPATPAQTGNGTCSNVVPADFTIAPFMTDPMYQQKFDSFVSTVQPVLKRHGCTSSNCHGAPQSDFYITCGDTDVEKQFNFTQAWSFVNPSIEDSQLLRVPLAVAAGGRGHTGGDQFESETTADYVALKTWAQLAGFLQFGGTPGKDFFRDKVQPILVQRGCSFQACHSPQATNDFKLRSGTQGFYSAVALAKNYDLLKNEFMALEYPDARRSRAVAKAILADDFRVTGVGGISHRAGAVLETQRRTTITPPDPVEGYPSDPAVCAMQTAATKTAFCVIQEWLTLERQALLTGQPQVTPMDAGDPIQIVYVERTTANVGRLEFDTFAGNGDLKVATTTFAAAQRINPADAGGASSLLTNCAGATPGSVDVQAPDVANDGTRVAFAMRRNANEPLTIWTVNIDGSNCQQLMAAKPDSGGIKVHDFDPAWSPDGQYIVFASTRGKPGYGASLSRKRFLPQSDLWRVRVSDGSVEQMTFLSNSEISPQFMREGRVTMTTEKTSDGFYQLAGRRINWDLTDYHPLLAQRARSLFTSPSTLNDMMTTAPSVGFPAATDIREGADGNFLLILSDVTATGAPTLPGGAGSLAIFNRSIGPFEAGRSDKGFLPSMRIIANATTSTTSGNGYRAPFLLPDGTIMVARATFPGPSWEIVSISPRTGMATTLFNNPNGRSRVDAVLAYKFPARTLYLNRRQLVFGGNALGTDAATAVVHMPDAPMLFTLLIANLRHGRPLELFSPARFLAVSREGMCPAGTGCTANTNGIYESRSALGSPVPLESDGSVKVQLPSATGVVFELQDGNHNSIVKMTEEHQLGPGENISMGVSRKLFDAVCAGCHGSITGHELDVNVTPDALTGASVSISAQMSPRSP